MNGKPISKSRIGLIVVAILVSSTPSQAANLSGTALTERGLPVANLDLIVVDRQTQKKIALTTDQSGGFSLEVPKGHYAVYAEHAGRTTLLAVLVMDAKAQRHLQIVVTDLGVLGFELPPPVPWQETVPPDSVADSDPTLASIRDYRIQAADIEKGSRPGLRSLAEMANPFPAKKSGGFHGSLYEFHRNDNFDARNFFDPVGGRLPEYKRNQFGVTLGTPLGTHLNLLATYEGLRIIQGSTLLSHVPTPAMKQGDFSGIPLQLRDPLTGQDLPGNLLPHSRIHPVSKRLLHLLPDPNQSDVDRNFINSKPIIRDRDSISLRVDAPIRKTSTIFVRYELSEGDHFSAHPLPSFGSIRKEREQEGALSYTRKINNRLLTTWRLDFDRRAASLGSVNAGQTGLIRSLGISGLSVTDPSDEGYPDFRLSGYASFGDAFLPITSVTNRIVLDASLAYTPEDHNLRLGMTYAGDQNNNHRSDGIRKGRFSFNGFYTGDAFADFVLGIPDSASRGVGSDRADLRRRSWNIFFRDQWKINTKFSLNLGLTYNRHPPFRSVHQNISGFHPLLFDPPTSGEIIIAGSGRAAELGFTESGSLVFPDRNDWAPSLGLAYSPFGNNRFLVRGSYWLGYSPVGAGYFVSYLGRNFPFYFVETAQASVDKPALDLAAPFESAVVTELGIRGIEPHIRSGQVHSWQLSVSNEVARHWGLSAAYRGNKGTRMPRILTANTPLPGPGPIQARRPNPTFGGFSILTSSGSFTRHSLDLGTERRLADGVSVTASATWNRSINDLYRGNPSNPRNLSAERGPADYQSWGRLSLNYIVDLPFGKSGRFFRSATGWAQAIIGGWRLSGITSIQTGDPFSVLLRGDQNNDGVTGDRPDRIGSGQVGAPERSINAWFDTADFTAPDAYSFGNSGRNILIGPSYHNWDLSVIKQARFSDGNLLEFRLELFNAFNHPNFDQPYAVYGTSVFGKIFGARRAREIEVALRYSF